MNRRTLVAGLAALVPTAASAQEASPEALEPKPSSVLRAYIRDVWNAREPDAIADYFSETLDLLDAKRQHIIAIDGLAEGDDPVRLEYVTSDSSVAMGYGTIAWAEYGTMDAFFLIRIGDDGMVRHYRWMTQPL